VRSPRRGAEAVGVAGMTIDYIGRVFRPPAEGDSLILQLAVGCPHNTCRFCGMYKGVTYRQRALPEMLEYIRHAAGEFPDATRIFLSDGDFMVLPYATLEAVFGECCARFHALSRITCYANGSSIAARTPEQICALRRLKLAIVYLGLETGDDELLRRVSKDENSDTMIGAVRMVQEARVKASVMVLLGLGGRAGSERHIAESARVLNLMQPRLLSALRLVDLPDARMYDGYETVTEYQSVRELRDLVAQLELERTVFAANHVSIPFPVKGRLPRDKGALLAALDRVLTSGTLDSDGPGATPNWL